MGGAHFPESLAAMEPVEAPPAADAEVALPSSAELEAELERERRAGRRRKVLASALGTLAVVSALAVLVATLWMPVLQVYGNSMAPTLSEGEYVMSLKAGDLETGDVVAFYYNNSILVKRVIAGPGDWVNIDGDGTVYVNGVELDEPYVREKSLGNCTIKLPYQVPESRVFVMGDHRSVSVDSRNASVGCVAQDQVVGKIVLRLWPMDAFGWV